MFLNFFDMFMICVQELHEDEFVLLYFSIVFKIVLYIE